MNSRVSNSFYPPHTQPASYIIRFFENLSDLTSRQPSLVSGLIKAVGISSLALAISPVVEAVTGYSAPVGLVGALAAGTVSITALIANQAQEKIFGYPVDPTEQVYRESECTYGTATAKIILNEGRLPLLKITADKYYDAGRVEGEILAEAMRVNIEKTNVLYTLMWLGMNAPKDHGTLGANLEPILKCIPENYHQEMQGKVDAYNLWLDKHHPEDTKLSYARYVLLQMLPDLRNYNPFPARKWLTSNAEVVPTQACTSIAVRLGKYTFFVRVLDWPSHGIAGKYFMQIDRKIGDTLRHIDTGFPLLSGVLTDVNEKGLFVEMNVAHGPAILKPEGIPATLYNRYVAENARCVADIPGLLGKIKPVGAYHLTASDGKDTTSFHFYQHHEVKNSDAIETLSENMRKPQTLVVANHGVKFEGNKATKVNHRDSDQRITNILRFFDQASLRKKFQQTIDAQKDDQPLSTDNINELREIFLQAARLALVSNCESVLCEILVFCGDKIESAVATADNMYAQRRDLSDFKQMYLP